MKRLPELSVFFPAYNEKENIVHTVTGAIAYLPQVAKTWEVIVVDDGSTDGTGEVVRKLMKKEKGLRLVTNKPNRGYGGALKRGLASCRKKYICYTDSDGQFKFSEITKFIRAIEAGADMVIGFRLKRADSPYRRFMARVLRLVGLVLFQINVKDVDCGFKLFKKEILERIGTLKTESAITETELVVRTKKAGFQIVEVGVEHHSRAGGEQTGGKPSVVFRAAREGLRLWFHLQVAERLS